MGAANEYYDKVLKVILEENGLKIKRVPEVLATRLGSIRADEGHLQLSVLHFGSPRENSEDVRRLRRQLER